VAPRALARTKPLRPRTRWKLSRPSKAERRPSPRLIIPFCHRKHKPWISSASCKTTPTTSHVSSSTQWGACRGNAQPVPLPGKELPGDSLRQPQSLTGTLTGGAAATSTAATAPGAAAPSAAGGAPLAAQGAQSAGARNRTRSGAREHASGAPLGGDSAGAAAPPETIWQRTSKRGRRRSSRL